MAELADAEKDAISHRGRAARALLEWLRRVTGRRRTAGPRAHARAAVSIASNTFLIALKLVAGAVTGSVAILTEAIHSAIDLIASCIAYFSVRQAEEPADAEHRYGHEKFENVAAAAEGVLILVGSGVIIYVDAHALIDGPELESLGFGIAVIGFASIVQPASSRRGCTGARARPSRPRSRATPRTCAPTPTPRWACSSASRSCSSPAPSGSTRSSRC